MRQRAEARQLALYHHDPDRDDDALDVIGRKARATYRGGDVIVAHEGLTITL